MGPWRSEASEEPQVPRRDDFDRDNLVKDERKWVPKSGRRAASGQIMRISSSSVCPLRSSEGNRG